MLDFRTLDEGPADRRPSARLVRSSAKRLMDVTVAGAALIALAPLMLLVAVAILIDDGGPVFFRQVRTGLGGRPFTIYKFRSMKVRRVTQDVRQATRGDPRLTRLGKLLRSLSIDELPQLFNILKGEMSLVGPRPHAIAHDEAWARMTRSYAGRFRARPGLTGYAQVTGLRGEILHADEVQARVDADNFYIDNWSLGLELSIMLRTVPLLFRDPNAY